MVLFCAYACSDELDELQQRIYQWYASFKDRYRQIITTALFGNSFGESVAEYEAETDGLASIESARAAVGIIDSSLGASGETITVGSGAPNLSDESKCAACCAAVTSLEAEVRALRHRLDRIETRRDVT